MSRMESMTIARKLKISISVDAQLLDVVDRRAAKEKTTRSAIMEQWLRAATSPLRQIWRWRAECEWNSARHVCRRRLV